jgi:hypothetical protein
MAFMPVVRRTLRDELLSTSLIIHINHLTLAPADAAHRGDFSLQYRIDSEDLHV